MAEISNLTASTELQAINAMLSNIGEAPVTGLDSGHPDVDAALELLRDTTRELETKSWEFNTEYDVRLCPDGTEDWVDPEDGTTTVLNVFKVPSDLASFQLSRIPDQQGGDHIDVVARLSTTYQESGEFVKVFYDRDYNRDGFPEDDRDHLWIDPVWFIDFEDLPQVARQYITVMAARRLAASLVGDADIFRFSLVNEETARRNFLKDQSPADRGNAMDHPSRRQFLGGRARAVGPLSHSRNRRR